ncbi:MAG TPA: site-specific integrase [Gaiellales bacterium]|nr:site-specific integrase [Gaiellales bacterium]
MQARKRTGSRQREKPWYVQYRLPDGKQRSPGFASKREADDWIVAHEREIRAARGLEPVVSSDSTVATYATHWLAAIEAGVKSRTHASYASQVGLYLVPRIGHRAVIDLGRPELRAFLIDCRKQGVSGTPLRTGSVYAIYATLRAMLNAAIEDGVRRDNPAAKLGKILHLHPTKAARLAAIRARALDREQTQTLLEHTRTVEADWYPIVLTLARTGIRLGECLMLRLTDWNPEARVLRIERAWNARLKREEDPKHGARTVDVASDLAAILDAHVAPLGKVVGLDGTPVVPWLFPSQVGTMLDGRNLRRACARLAEGAKLGRTLKPHDLRHTFGSQLVAAGKSPVYVQRQMGHASVQTTIDLYGSGLPLDERHGVDVLVPPAREAGGGTMVAQGAKMRRGRRRA